jgi:uncharacterized membrane protein
MKEKKHEDKSLKPQKQEHEIEPIGTHDVDISPEAAEVLKSLSEEKRGVIINEIVRFEQRTFAGPVPHPDHLAGYEKTLPGAANRILEMAEREQRHRHEIESDLLKTKHKEHKRGQNIGCILVVFLAIVAGGLGFLSHDWLSGAIFTTTIVSVIIVYVLEKKPKMNTDKTKEED